MDKTINICKDFTDAPGGRLKSDGPKSAEEFRDILLIPALENLEQGETLLVDLDGCYGFATSFLEESFGGLSRIYGSKYILERISIKSEDEPTLINEIFEYINNADK